MNVSPNVHEGIKRVQQERLKPAVLNQTSSKNLLALLSILEDAQVNAQTPVHQIVDILERGIKVHMHELKWDAAPKALSAGRAEQGIARVENPLVLEAERAKKLKEAEAKEAQAKADEASQRQITDLINAVQLIDHRRQRIAYGVTEQAKENLRKYAANAKAHGESLQVIAKTVAAKINGLYKADERSRERV